MFNSSQRPTKTSVQFWLLAAFLVIVFSTGGSSRSDVQSVAILYPASILFCGAALATLKISTLANNKVVFIGIGFLFLMMLLQRVIMWPALSAQTALADVGAIWVAIGPDTNGQYLSLVPSSGLHSTAAIATPLAILLLGVQLSWTDISRLLPIVIVLASVSGFMGLSQTISDPYGPLYLYRITNNGSAVGLFANRNHSATLLSCLFPMLALYASTRDGTTREQLVRHISCIAVGIVILPLILITGSRSGLLTGVVGLAGAAIIYNRSNSTFERHSKKLKKVIPKMNIPVGLAIIGLGLLTYFFDRAQAIERLFLDDVSGDNRRADFLIVSLDLFWKYFPIGSGSESFATVYLLAEPDRLLNPSRLNRAHNDWIEFAVTFGALGLMILAAMVSYYCVRSFFLWQSANAGKLSVQRARMAAIAISMIALASISDYPLRTPIMASVFSILILWFMEVGKPLNKEIFKAAAGRA